MNKIGAENLSEITSEVDRAAGDCRRVDNRDREIDVIILAGSVGHEAAWARGVPRALLPLTPEQSVLTALLDTLTHAFNGTTTICANGSTHSVETHVASHATNLTNIRYYRDNMPRGTGGCIRAAVAPEQKRTMLVTGGAVWLEDDPQWMVTQHQQMGNALTVFCTEQDGDNTIDGHRALTPTGVYCVEPSVLPHIREVGFQDLKEQVIPALKKAGLRVGAVVLRKPAIEISDCRDYLRAVSRALATGAGTLNDYRELAPGIWCGQQVTIASDARIVGPAVIGHGSHLESQSMVIGPAIIGHHCTVGERTWAIRSVVPNETRLQAGRRYTDTFVTEAAPVEFLRNGQHAPPRRDATAPGPSDSAHAPQPARHTASVLAARLVQCWLPTAAMCAAFAWAYASSLGRLWGFWQSNGDYSAGQLVPLAAFYMIASRRSTRRDDRQFQCWSVGLIVFAAGVAIHLLGSGYHYHSLENMGMVLSAVGIIMSIVGRQEARRLWYPMLFMFLMLPLPNRVHSKALEWLQDISTGASRMGLEILSIPVTQRGHVLDVSGYGLSVAEACSGLRMAIAFFIVTAFLVYLVRRPRWQKVFVLASSVPIAIGCNVARIVLLASLYHLGFGGFARGAFHDGAGMIMMPVALLVVLLEFRLLQRLTTSADPLTAFQEPSNAARVVFRS